MAPEDKKTRITVTFPTNAYFISGLRDFTFNIIKNTTKFPEKWAYRFQSIVDELCNNAIEHGSAPGSDIRITFIHEPADYLEIAVEDTGTGQVKMNSEELTNLIKDRRTPGYIFSGIRGRGLSKIVAEWSDELNIKNKPEGGLIVSIKKFLKDEQSTTPTTADNTTKKIYL